MRHGFDDVGLDRIIAQTLAANTSSRAVLERIGLTYVRTYPTSMTAPVEGVDEGEVEYEMTREQWKRDPRQQPNPNPIAEGIPKAATGRVDPRRSRSKRGRASVQPRDVGDERNYPVWGTRCGRVLAMMSRNRNTGG